MRESDRARHRLRLFAFVLAGAFAAIAVLNWWTGRENLREGSRVLSEGGPALEIKAIPTTYRAVYRIENRAGNRLTVTTEKVWVRRPFSSRIESFRGAPPGTRRLTVRQSAFGVLTNVGEKSAPLNLAVPPSLASGDLRIDAVLSEAVLDRTVLRRERREVYGRRCQVYRAGGPVSAGDLTRYEAGGGQYADVCVDGSGLVIEEYWVSKGRLIQRRVAVEVEVDLPMNSDLFEIDVPTNPQISRGSVQRLPAGAGGSLWVLDEPPPNFEKLGRYRVAFPETAVPRASQFDPSVAPVSISEVYVRGPDLFVIDQDPSLQVVTSNEGRQTRPAELNNFSRAVLIFDARMSEVRGEAPGGSIVRVFGTLRPSELLRLAGRLVHVEG